MAITYYTQGNNLFLDPDTTTEDTFYTMDDIVAAYPALVERKANTYFIACNIVVAGTSTARAVLTAKSTVLYFTAGVLGNDGGRVILGEKGTTDEGDYTKDGCDIIMDGDDSVYGEDPYKVTHSSARTLGKKYPLCGQDGQIYFYDTKLNLINTTKRSDMLDMAITGSQAEIIDCIIDGNGDYGSQASYTHLFLVDSYLENVKISNFGIFELRYQTLRDWVGVTLLKQSIGVSVSNASLDAPIRLKDLTVKGVDFITKKPGLAYLELIDLNYTGDNWYSIGTNGWTKLLSSVDVTTLYDAQPLANARVILLNDKNIAAFNGVTDTEGTIPTQEVLTDYSSEGSDTFDVHYNPFIFRAYSYGKLPIVIPTTITPPNKPKIIASFLDHVNVTQTEAYSSAIDVDVNTVLPDGEIQDSLFREPLVRSRTNTTVGQWSTSDAGSSMVYTSGAGLHIRRNGYDPNWNGGAIVYQYFSGLTVGYTYKIKVNVTDMGGAQYFRFGTNSSFEDYRIEGTGTYEFDYVATVSDGKIVLNTHGDTYVDHVVIQYFLLYDPAIPVGVQDPNGNYYDYICDCKGNTLNDVFHALHYKWAQIDSSFITSLIPEGLSIEGSGNYHGGKGLMFENYVGNLRSITANNGINYNYPTTTEFKLIGLKEGSEVRIYKASDYTELEGIESSATSFEYYHQFELEDVMVIIFNLMYEPIRLEITLTADNLSIPIQQTFDRNYKNN